MVSRLRPDSQRGFTLIELIVVLALIGILISFATLAMPDLGESDSERSVARLQRALIQAQADAQFRGSLVGLRFTAQGWQRVELREATGSARHWQSSAERQPWPSDSDVRLRIDQTRIELTAASRATSRAASTASHNETAPQLILMPTGETQALRLDITQANGESASLISDMLGRSEIVIDGKAS